MTGLVNQVTAPSTGGGAGRGFCSKPQPPRALGLAQRLLAGLGCEDKSLVTGP